MVALMVAAQPFVEWLIHVHPALPPREVSGRTVDLHLAKKHRIHHLDPKRIDAVFIPLRSLLIGLPFYLVIVLVVFPLPIALTILVTQFAIGNVYEWTHFTSIQAASPRTGMRRTSSARIGSITIAMRTIGWASPTTQETTPSGHSRTRTTCPSRPPRRLLGSTARTRAQPGRSGRRPRRAKAPTTG